MDRRRVRPLPHQGRPQGAYPGGVRDAGRRQGGALARPSGADHAGGAQRADAPVPGTPLEGLRGHGRVARRAACTLLEGALWDEAAKEFESADGKPYLRILEFDVASEKWTGRHWKYVLEDKQNAIGDFNLIDAENGLIIERDNGEGTADKACRRARSVPTASMIWPASSASKVALNDANVGGPVRARSATST